MESSESSEQKKEKKDEKKDEKTSLKMVSSEKDEVKVDRWSVYFDDNSMKPYYYNWTTGETTWDRPKNADLSSMGAIQTNVTTESYEAQAAFRTIGGKFDAADCTTHWERTGIPSNRTDRQMSMYMDISQLEKNASSSGGSGGKKRKQTKKAPNGKTWKEYNAAKKKKRAKRALES